MPSRRTWATAVRPPSAELNDPGSVRSDGDGNLLIADTGDNQIRVVAGTTGTQYGVAMTRGDIYTIAGNGTQGSSGDDGAATSAELDGPQSAILDRYGNVVIADTGNNRVRVVAESTGTFYDIAMTQGDIYTVAGTGTAGYNGDATTATGAELDAPVGLALDQTGNIVVADSKNDRVRVISAGTSTDFGAPMTDGGIVTIMGGGTRQTEGSTPLNVDLSPDRVAVDGRGDLVVSDDGSERIWVLAGKSGTLWGQSMTAGDAYFVAGGNTNCASYTASGAATSAYLCDPAGVVVDPTGDIDVASPEINRIFTIGNAAGRHHDEPAGRDGGHVVQRGPDRRRRSHAVRLDDHDRRPAARPEPQFRPGPFRARQRRGGCIPSPSRPPTRTARPSRRRRRCRSPSGRTPPPSSPPRPATEMRRVRRAREARRPRRPGWGSPTRSRSTRRGTPSSPTSVTTRSTWWRRAAAPSTGSP